MPKCYLFFLIFHPHRSRLEENIGDAWWPASWRCPSAFAPTWHGLLHALRTTFPAVASQKNIFCARHVLYFVAPPSRLQPGQFDLVREVHGLKPLRVSKLFQVSRHGLVQRSRAGHRTMPSKVPGLPERSPSQLTPVVCPVELLTQACSVHPIVCAR